MATSVDVDLPMIFIPTPWGKERVGYMKMLGPDNSELSLGGIQTVNWDGTALDAAMFDECQISVTGLTAPDTITVYGGVTGVNPKAIQGANMGDNTLLASHNVISADGLYSFPPVGKISYVKAGTASVALVVNLQRR